MEPEIKIRRTESGLEAVVQFGDPRELLDWVGRVLAAQVQAQVVEEPKPFSGTLGELMDQGTAVRGVSGYNLGRVDGIQSERAAFLAIVSSFENTGTTLTQLAEAVAKRARL